MVSCTLGIFGFGFVGLVVAFFSSSWIVLSDFREINGRVDGFGLWTQCFRYLNNSTVFNQNDYNNGRLDQYSLHAADNQHLLNRIDYRRQKDIPNSVLNQLYNNQQGGGLYNYNSNNNLNQNNYARIQGQYNSNPNNLNNQNDYNRRQGVYKSKQNYNNQSVEDCQMFYDPFTLGLDNYRRLPPAPYYIIISTRALFTLAFVLSIIASVLGSFLCCGLDELSFNRRVVQVGLLVLAAGLCAAAAVAVFAIGLDEWLPIHGKSLGWAFGLAVASALVLIVAGIVLLVESCIPKRMVGDVQKLQASDKVLTEPAEHKISLIESKNIVGVQKLQALDKVLEEPAEYKITFIESKNVVDEPIIHPVLVDARAG